MNSDVVDRSKQQRHLTVHRDNEHVQGTQRVEIDQMSAELKATHGTDCAMVQGKVLYRSGMKCPEAIRTSILLICLADTDSIVDELNCLHLNNIKPTLVFEDTLILTITRTDMLPGK
jgi:hypothetical protein